jgi:hypothetical protein
MAHREHMNVEIQQRACEYLQMMDRLDGGSSTDLLQ